LIAYNNGSNWSNKFIINSNGNVGIGLDNPSEKLEVNGTTKTKILEITGGSDIAEPYFVHGNKIRPGMIVSISEENIGELEISKKKYDKKVAGIISGAGGISPGLILKQESSIADGNYPVAMSGRVYCYVDADINPIKIGDLITTSEIPGYGMKASNSNKSFGTVVGKAMTPLESGKGLVLILVSLQ